MGISPNTNPRPPASTSFVYFYLLKYVSGDVGDHDFEVNEARWVEIDQAIKMLAFASDKKIVEKAKTMIAGE